VIPDPRIKTADNLPYFSIIQEDIREKGGRKGAGAGTGRKKNGKKENRDFDIAHFKSIDFFRFINAQAMMKKTKTKKSPSLQRHHKSSKYAGIHLGKNEEKKVEEKIKIIYEEGNEQMKKSQHEKQLLRLLESSGTGTRGIGRLPDTQDSMKQALRGGGRLNLRKDVLK